MIRAEGDVWMSKLIAAALNAWPGVETKTTYWPNDDGAWIVPRHALSLPLAQKQEDGDGK